VSNSEEVGLVKMLGMHVDHASPDKVQLSWDVTPEHRQAQGIVHGAVFCAAVETAASVGANLWYGDRGQVAGVSNETDFLHPVHEGTLTAIATPIHRGRRQQLWQVEVTDERATLIAHGQARLRNVAGPVEKG
jgi:1,4-dihydroxy-2-naphthoyl-CoA hydrolase